MLPASKAFTTTWGARQEFKLLSRKTLSEFNTTVRCLKGRKRTVPGRTRLSAISFAVGLAGSNGSNDPLYNSINPMSTSEEPKEQSSASKPSFQSIDPSASGEDITVIHAPEEFQAIKDTHDNQLICLMCKAIGCRPCKMFARKYQRVAASNQGSLFLEVTGDESTDLRKLMIQLGIRATPTFKFFYQGECIHTHTGIDEAKLRAAIETCQEKLRGPVAPAT